MEKLAEMEADRNIRDMEVWDDFFQEVKKALKLHIGIFVDC